MRWGNDGGGVYRDMMDLHNWGYLWHRCERATAPKYGEWHSESGRAIAPMYAKWDSVSGRYTASMCHRWDNLSG